MKKDENIVMLGDENLEGPEIKGQYYCNFEENVAYVSEEPEQYYPAKDDHAKVPNIIIDRYGNISYLADLAVTYAFTCLEDRKEASYKGTAIGKYYEDMYKTTKTNFADGLVASFTMADFRKAFSLNSGGRMYKQLNDLLNGDQMKFQWEILYRDRDIIASTAVVTGTAYDRKTGRIYIKFNSDLKPYIYELKKGFTDIAQPVLGKLKEVEFAELYKRLQKDWEVEEYINNKKGLPARSTYDITYLLDELYFIIGYYVPDVHSTDPLMMTATQCVKDGRYSEAIAILKETEFFKKMAKEKKISQQVDNFPDFRRYFLNRAFKKINGFTMPTGLDRPGSKNYEKAYAEYVQKCKEWHPTEIHFWYECGRSAKGGKVDKIIFHVKKIDWEEVGQQTLDVLIEDVPTVDVDAFIGEIRQLITEKLSDKDLKNIAKVAKYDMTAVTKAYTVAKEKPRDNLVGTIITAIKEGWEPAVKTEVEEEPVITPEMVKVKIHADDVLHMHPMYEDTLNTFVDVICDFLNSDATKVKIGGGMMPADVVKERIFALNSLDISEAIAAFLDSTSQRVTDSYILTILFNLKKHRNLEIAQNIQNEWGYYS